VVKDEGDHKALYFSGRRHPGENLDDVLEKRRRISEWRFLITTRSPQGHRSSTDDDAGKFVVLHTR
jgi:hypothetical protein